MFEAWVYVVEGTGETTTGGMDRSWPVRAAHQHGLCPPQSGPR
jgi:hypothetical protein